MIELVQGQGNKILEIGCGEGNLGRELKRSGKAQEVIGIEIVPEIAVRAIPNLDRVIQGNIEHLELPFEPDYFDYIIMGDVIEHLIDPWGCLTRIRLFLKPTGSIVASIPNINHWRVLADLIFRDKWEYKQAGTLDSTHLRFFTKQSVSDLFIRSGYGIERIMVQKSTNPLILGLNVLTLKKGERFLAYKYIVRAQKIVS